MISYRQLLDLSLVLLTPLIAVIATYIAWQQWKTNQLKVKLDRYDRRLKVYEEVQSILRIILRDANASYDDLLRFRISVAEADFLFGAEITEFIEEIYQRGLKLTWWTKQYRDYTQQEPPGYDHQKVVDGMHSELTWITSQFDPARLKFKRYLDISG